MATSKNLDNFIINKVETMEVYEYMVDNGLVNEDELYLVQETTTNENELPSVTTANNGAFLRVVNGTWAVSTMANAEEASF